MLGMADGRSDRMRDAAGASASEREDPLIAGFARAVAGECEADGVLVALHGVDGQATPLFFAGDEPDAVSTERTMLAAAAQAANGRAADSVWQTFDLPGERTAASLTTTITDGDAAGQVTVTTWFGSLGAATRMRARTAIARIAPMVSAFVRMWRQRTRAQTQLLRLTAAVNHSDVGILIVDRSGSAQFANAAAQDLLVEGDAVRLTGTRLGAVRLTDTLRLQATLEHVAATGGGEGPATSVLALARAGRRPLMVAITADPATPGSAIVNLFDPERNLRALVEPVCKLYRLSPVETRLACLLADGVSLAEAAAAMRVREQSARSYLKQVFLKTDTNRQAELVGLLLRSSVRAACSRGVSFV